MSITLLVVLVCATSLVQIINSKKYRAIMSDEILAYELDKSVSAYSKYFSLDNLILEQTGDDIFFVGGYIECIISFDKHLAIRQDVRTQFFQDARWNEGQMKFVNYNLCAEFVNANRYSHKFTKLWTSEVCPPQKGDKWYVENQTLSAIIELPQFSFDIPWRVFTKLSQGLHGMEKSIMGVGYQLEFVQV